MVNKARVAKLIKSSKTGGDLVIETLPQIQTHTSVIPVRQLAESGIS